jgi:NTP pyrophosphatase (non-canonical NTP hydrolase)
MSWATSTFELGEALRDVWQQARENHRTYSDTGDKESDIRFLTLGLAGEAGEVANFVKKRWRDGDSHDEAIRLEIADVLAYAFMLADTNPEASEIMREALENMTEYAERVVEAFSSGRPHLDLTGFPYLCKQAREALSPICKGEQ